MDAPVGRSEEGTPAAMHIAIAHDALSLAHAREIKQYDAFCDFVVTGVIRGLD